MKKNLFITLITVFINLTLFAQVEFNPTTNDWFKTYGVPNVDIHDTYSSGLRSGNKTLKMNIYDDGVGNKIRKISKMSSLQLLKMVNCGVTQLPAEIGELRDLFILVSMKNPISYISPEIGGCSNLMYLDLWDTKLDSLPKEMQYLRGLELLRILGNTSTDTFKLDSIKRFPRLRSIHIADADLYKFPDVVLRSKKLESIKLTGCKLKSIPEEIIYLENIKELILDGNQLTQLPQSITKLRNLEVLSVKNNKLTTISEFIVYLPKLRVLDVSENQIPLTELDILRVLMKRKGQFVSDYEKLTELEIDKKKKQQQK